MTMFSFSRALAKGLSEVASPPDIPDSSGTKTLSSISSPSSDSDSKAASPRICLTIKVTDKFKR